MQYCRECQQNLEKTLTKELVSLVTKTTKTRTVAINETNTSILAIIHGTKQNESCSMQE